MAITAVRATSRDIGGRISGPGQKEYTATYMVSCSSTPSFADVITADVGGVAIPDYGAHLLDPATGMSTGLTVTDITAKPAGKSPLIWLVEVKYSRGLGGGGGNGTSSGAGHGEGGLGPVGGGGGGSGSAPGMEGSNVPGHGETQGQNPQQIENPLLEPIQAQYRTVKRTKVIERDLRNIPITNSALMPFSPALQLEIADIGITITRNELVFNRLAIAVYVGAINSAPWMGSPAKEWKLDDMSATLRFKNGIFYWEVTYQFEHNREGWNPVKVLDAGLWQISSDGDSWERCKDRFGNPATRPVMLDLEGRQLQIAAGELVSEGKFLEYQIYREVDFNDLGLH